MQKLFLSPQEAKLYIYTHQPEKNIPSRQVLYKGRRFTKISLFKNLHFLTRLAKVVAALTLTVISLFLALLSKEVRALWSYGLLGKEKVAIYTKPVPDYLAEMQVLPCPAGYIGPQDEKTVWPRYWKHLRLETGAPLPIDSKDFVLKVYVQKKGRSLPKSLPKELFFPYALLENVRNGEALRLLYKDSLIEMRASSRRSEGGKRFDEQTGDIAKAFWQDDRTGLDMSSVFTLNRLNPLFFYTLEGGGAAYNMTYQNGRFCLHEKEGAALQQISDDMQLTESPCDFTEEPGRCVISLNFAGEVEDCDIILNSKFLLFVTSNYYGATIRKLRWDIIPRLRDKTLDEMKQLMHQAGISRGLSTLKFSLPC